jgi:hypothetical protein
MVPPFLYPNAGAHAPEPVRVAIRAIRALPEAVRAARPLLYLLLGDTTRPYKFDKTDVSYRTSPQGEQRCGNCWRFFHRVVTDSFVCELVGGPIRPAHWCDRWRATNPDAHAPGGTGGRGARDG